MIQRHDSLIVQVITRFLVPVFQMFAAYVFFHGHYSPGGGFQAGVMIGASLVLEMLVGTKKELERFSVQREFKWASSGLALYALLGAAALLFGGQYLNYGRLGFLGEDEPMRRYWAILIAEAGVTMVVSMTIVIIFQALAFLPDHSGGKQP
jgi:multicomponent Na+:H+ antiporter subunit B